MGKLSISSNLSTEHLDLLEAVGFETDRDLADAEAPVVHRELVRANEVLALAAQVPTVPEIESWIGLLRKHRGRRPVVRGSSRQLLGTAVDRREAPAGGGSGSSASARQAADFENPTPTPEELLASASLAVPIPNRTLANAGIKPMEIPIALDLDEAVIPEPVAVETRPDTQSPVQRQVAGAVNRNESRAGERLGIDVSRLKRVEDAVASPIPKPPEVMDERTQRLRSARDETNRGRDRGSRLFVRGVLHDRPVLVTLGCVNVLLFQVSLPLAVLVTPWIILAESQSAAYAWVPSWLVLFPLAVPLLGITYFMTSFRVKCRVCGARLLSPRQCLKNRKAHHLPLLGHIFALALHTLLFRWFNCTYCGTPVRVKE